MHQSDRGNLPFIVLKLEHFADKEKCIFKSEFFKKKKKNLTSQSSSQAISASSSALNTTYSCNSSLPLAQASLSNGWRHMLLISSAGLTCAAQTPPPAPPPSLPAPSLLFPHQPQIHRPPTPPTPASLTEQHCLLAWQEASREKEGAGNTRSFESQSCG